MGYFGVTLFSGAASRSARTARIEIGALRGLQETPHVAVRKDRED